MSKWTDFMKGKMAPYMKEYGSHTEAMKHLSKEYKAQQGGSKKSTGTSRECRKKRNFGGEEYVVTENLGGMGTKRALKTMADISKRSGVIRNYRIVKEGKGYTLYVR